MGKSIVFAFPGGRGTEIPLLYFGAKHYEDKGYEKVFIAHPSDRSDFEALYENAKEVLKSYDFEEYEDVVFVAKSIGTVVACKVKEELQVDATLILFTPLAGALPYIKSDNRIVLVATGERDRHLESERLREHCENEKVPCYIEPDIGHRMEVKNDMVRNLQVIGNVIGRLE